MRSAISGSAAATTHEQRRGRYPVVADWTVGHVVAMRANGEVMEFLNSTDAWEWLDSEFAVD